jgi:hypothetical protein
MEKQLRSEPGLMECLASSINVCGTARQRDGGWNMNGIPRSTPRTVANINNS